MELGGVINLYDTYTNKCEEMNERDLTQVLSLILKLGIDLCFGSSVGSIDLPT